MAYLAGAPVWVWPLLAGLIAIGLVASRTREAPVIVYAFLPLFILMTLRTIAQSEAPLVAWAGFALTYGAGAIWGHRLQKGWILARSGSRVRVKGEWVTLISVLMIFSANFAQGLFAAVKPDLLHNLVFVAVFAMVISLPSGLFLGRAVAVLRS